MKELKIYLIVIVIVALTWHNKQWIDHPIEHILNLPYGGAFGIPGIIHPLVFGFLAYAIVWILKLPFKKRYTDKN
jgi:hypothetical protein